MFGSLYYNFWVALIGFTIYFLAKFQTPQAPLSIILFGLMWAIIAFFVTFILRGILGYILYTPELEEEGVEEELTEGESQNQEANQAQIPSEKQSEEIAKVVQTMLQQEEK